MDYSHEPHGVYFLIDNKSFYASVECVSRGLEPLKTCLVVMSEADNTNGGLILATSPMAKQLFHITNVSRRRDLPDDPRLIIVPPRMNLYIKKNLQINTIFQRFVADEDLYPYSIDESILDLTHSWRLFGSSPQQVAQLIQDTVHKELGLRLTVGIGENPLQAKIALDVYAKHDQNFIGQVTYATVPTKLWTISNLVDVWSIGKRTARHLTRLGITNLFELAHSNPYMLVQEMGIIGAQLFALAWGIDRSKLSQRIKPKDKSLGNSQVLPRDYSQQTEIELVIKEIGQQVAARVRHHHQLTSCLSLSIGFAYAADTDTKRSGFSHECKLEPTDESRLITEQLLRLFRQFWQGEAIRNIAVYCSRLCANTGEQLDLFTPLHRQIKQQQFDHVVDQVRAKFGTTSLVMASSLLRGGTLIRRSALVGGHNGGNSFE
ncbi:Y-family DNA polymerase [Loigolactobacillus iwatensis]|uniref:Y-family DNA polymerase n=1 Tax=Loigolactobacillus iwatensis TaxID=1267156 RepID=UPI000F7DA904|nr:Y-family DNA polymerase [Loigolactobacillus iwatensis]